MKWKIIVAVFLTFLLVGCGKVDPNKIYKTISQEDAFKFVGEDRAVLIDVREIEEYQAGHIEHAVNIPLDQITQNSMKEITENKIENIIVYCQTGIRSKEAALKLLKMGYHNTYDLGGIESWTMSELIK